MPKKKRRGGRPKKNYTDEFKLAVVIHAEDYGIAAAAELYDVSLASVKRWKRKFSNINPEGFTHFRVVESLMVPHASLLTVECEECGAIWHVIPGEEMKHCPSCQRRNVESSKEDIQWERI